MKVYVVYGDTYFDSCGSEIHIFGVFSSIDDALEAKKLAEDEQYNKYMNDPYGYRDDGTFKRANVVFNIKQIMKDRIIDEYLGGYAE